LTWYHSAAENGVLGALFSFTANLGWLGVQLFFVLSGFLITGILLDGKGQPHQLPHFYMRRMLRIFPLYFFVLLVGFVLLPLLGLLPQWLESDRAHQVWYWTFLINWAAPIVGGGSTFSHFWSLAVEEQFYLLWPLLVITAGNRTMLWLCAVFIGSAILIRAALIRYNLDFAVGAAYQFTVARWDALAVGALLALVLRQRQWCERLIRLAPFAAALLLIYLMAYVAIEHNFAPVDRDAALNQTVAALLFGLLIFVAVYPAAAGRSLAQRGVSSAWLRSVGKYSYAIYVFHLPMMHVWGVTLKKISAATFATMPLLEILVNIFGVFALSLALSLLSWHLLEQPFLRLKKRFA
jgi:peptidoglycan/LPS O-acetylase OafA/YrhL